MREYLRLCRELFKVQIRWLKSQTESTYINKSSPDFIRFANIKSQIASQCPLDQYGDSPKLIKLPTEKILLTKTKLINRSGIFRVAAFTASRSTTQRNSRNERYKSFTLSKNT